MFAVVKFIPTEPEDCEEVEAIPVGWLSPGKTHCFWPPMKSGDAIARAIRNQVPRGLHWNAHRAEVMKICGMKCIFTVAFWATVLQTVALYAIRRLSVCLFCM